jgi:hypothetical protein
MLLQLCHCLADSVGDFVIFSWPGLCCPGNIAVLGALRLIVSDAKFHLFSCDVLSWNSCCSSSGCLHTVLSFLFVFYGAGDQTQGLVNARQALITELHTQTCNFFLSDYLMLFPTLSKDL